MKTILFFLFLIVVIQSKLVSVHHNKLFECQLELSDMISCDVLVGAVFPMDFLSQRFKVDVAGEQNKKLIAVKGERFFIHFHDVDVDIPHADFKIVPKNGFPEDSNSRWIHLPDVGFDKFDEMIRVLTDEKI